MGPPQTGDRINNYLLDERIAVGGFGEVWKAHHHVFHETVAIKLPTDPDYVRHLQREGLAAHALRHPNIVRVIDLDPYATPPYLVTEYVDGPSLRRIIERHPDGLPIEPVIAILYGTLAALSAAHQAGVVHRDIKPDNILIAGGPELSDMTPARVRVTDFGLGRCSQTAAGAMVQSGSIVNDTGRHLAGTIAYMSPEQRDGLVVDARSDLYSLGVVLHEMLTGVLPQGTDLPGSIRRDVPQWLDEIFERCYARRERRFTSSRQIQEMIEDHVASPWVSPGANPPALPRVWPSDGSARCGYCHGLVEAEDQFCIHCGRQLVECVPRCPACQAFVGARDNFCILCGRDLRLAVRA